MISCHQSIIFIYKDHHAVHAFTLEALAYLRSSKRLLVTVVQFTDGCASQYKSKGPFTDVSDEASQYDCSHFERNFFGSQHGKGQADGEAAVVKEGCRKAIKSGEEISDSAEMFNYLHSSHLHIKPTQTDHKHYRRSFFHINSINRERGPRATTVKRTRNFH